jgi:hypothetical protein
MNNKIFPGLIFVVIVTTFFCCSKAEEEEPPAEDLVFYSLVSEKDTIMVGEQTRITASATGSQLEYFWSASLGDIVGSGSEVTYVASPCQAGKNQITCKITNGSTQSETKSIYIVVI